MYFSTWFYFSFIKAQGMKSRLFKKPAIETDTAEVATRTLNALGRAIGARSPGAGLLLFLQGASPTSDWDVLAESAANWSTRNSTNADIWTAFSDPGDSLLGTLSGAAEAAFDSLQQSGNSPFTTNEAPVAWKAREIDSDILLSQEFLTWIHLVFTTEVWFGLTRPNQAIESLAMDSGLAVEPAHEFAGQMLELARGVASLVSEYEAEGGSFPSAPPGLVKFVGIVRSSRA